MWIPPDIMTTVCFLCVEHQGRKLYGGTAFFVLRSEPDFPDLKWAYLVTASHCVEKAFRKYNNLFYRLNDKNGGVKFVELPPFDSPKWVMSDCADVAILPFDEDPEAEMQCLPSEMFITDELIQKEGIGLGDELFLIGLFKEVQGRKRNFPVIRSAMIASMPDELFQDKDTGTYYRAFLIEARSIGGLSGSPVFMALKKRGVQMHPAPRGFNAMTHSMIMVGLIRGHFDLADQDSSLTDFGGNQLERLNSGIAIVTPIQEVEKVLMSDELKKQRRADIRQYQNDHAPTLDSEFGNDSTQTTPEGHEIPVPTKDQFLGDLKKASRKKD
jgi:hypothetical protein